MEKHIKMMALYVATLKAIALIHQQNHWLSKGDSFYAHHLLFERIYNSALKDLDLAAEKLIGLFGDKVLDYDLQAQLLHGVLSIFSKFEGSPVAMSLAVEKQFLNMASNLANYLQEEGHQSLGLADAFGAIASSREEAIYLLQQTQDE